MVVWTLRLRGPKGAAQIQVTNDLKYDLNGNVLRVAFCNLAAGLRWRHDGGGTEEGDWEFNWDSSGLHSSAMSVSAEINLGRKVYH